MKRREVEYETVSRKFNESLYDDFKDDLPTISKESFMILVTAISSSMRRQIKFENEERRKRLEANWQNKRRKSDRQD